GLSDSEIEDMAARGDLSAEQMQAWLERQADSLVAARADAAMVDEGELGPPEPAEFPSWLEDALQQQELGVPSEQAALVDQITEPPAPADLPDWLDQTPGDDEAEADLLELLEQAQPASTEGDPWAEALDAEFASQQLGAADEEPAWYRTALEDPLRHEAVEASLLEEDEAEFAIEEEDLALPEPAELPDWLQPSVPEAAVPVAAPVDPDMPDWLTEEIPVVDEAVVDNWLEEQEIGEEEEELEPLPAAEIPDWLQAPEEVQEVPDWLLEAAPEPPVPVEPAPSPAVPEPAPAAPAAPVPAAPAPVAIPVYSVPISAALPQGEAYATFRSRLETNPQDHDTRLELARTLNQRQALPDSLGQYQALVQAQAHLDTIERDLRALVEANPGVPQARRVLGDAIMRQGRLQEALETYRAALEQL
ncbi:MAG: hypothetical protein JW910_01535, partial [Anaerolineae bacterium]|nr:hypothetical protein [Anaerolineae bacterium]